MAEISKITPSGHLSSIILAHADVNVLYGSRVENGRMSKLSVRINDYHIRFTRGELEQMLAACDRFDQHHYMTELYTWHNPPDCTVAEECYTAWNAAAEQHARES